MSTAANVTEWLRYDALGNLCQKRNGDGTVNAYTYTALGGCGLGGSPGSVAAGPVNSGYQLLQAGKEYFTTDANGSLTRSATAASGGTIQRGWDYDGGNHAVAVWKGASATAAVARTRWDYGPDGSRFRRTDDGTGWVNSSTLYLDNVERVTTGGSVTWRRTVAGTVMTLAGTTAGLVNSTRTLLGDQIGSVDAVADLSSGGLVERADYAAFGAMRTALSTVVVGVAPLTTTTRGFTGQEQLATLDLVHLNGRIYDNWPVPNNDPRTSATYLLKQPSMSAVLERFSRLFIMDGARVWEFSGGAAAFHMLRRVGTSAE